MDFLDDHQRAIIEKFVAKVSKIIENGYVYAFTHPNVVKAIQCEANRIKEIEKIRGSRPLPCHDKMLSDAYLRYIIKIVRLGLKYIQSNRESYADFVELQNVLYELTKAQSSQQPQPSYQRPQSRYQRPQFEYQRPQRQAPRVNKTYKVDSVDSTENFFSSTFQQLEDLCSKIDSLRLRVDSMSKMKETRPKCSIKRSQDGMRQLNKELAAKLQQLKQERLERIKKAAESSDEGSLDEIVLDFEHFTQPLLQKQQRTPVRVGPIQRNIVIPLQSENPPNLKPKYVYNRSRNGEMTFDIKLDFDEGVMMNEKLANGIYIKSSLPVRTLWERK